MVNIISTTLKQTTCLACLKRAMLVEEALRSHVATEALEEVAQNPVLQFREPQVPWPLSSLSFLLARWLCEALWQSLVERNWLNCSMDLKGDFAFFQIIDLQLCFL